MKNRILFLSALVAAYLAASPADTKRIADLHRLRDDAFRDDPPEADEAEAIAHLLRAAEVAIPTADAKAAADRTAGFLTSDDVGNAPAPVTPAPDPAQVATPDPEATTPPPAEKPEVADAGKNEGGTEGTAETPPATAPSA